MKRFFSGVLIVSTLLCTALFASPTAFAADADSSPEPFEYGFVDSDGVQIEYGVYGLENGEPLLLLPPNGGSMHSFDGNILPEMSKHFKVITVSPRGTGKSDRGSGRLTFDVMSDDLVNLLDYLEIEKTDIFGFSDGGNLGFVFTLAHQERVKSLVAMGANINTCGTKTTNQIGIELEYLFLCIKAYITKDEAVALKRDIQGLMVRQPSLTYKDLAAIKVPVLNIYGQYDMIKRSHSKKIVSSIDGAKGLMIVDGGHSSCFDQTETVINPALLEFWGKAPKNV